MHTFEVTYETGSKEQIVAWKHIDEGAWIRFYDEKRALVLQVRASLVHRIARDDLQRPGQAQQAA